MGRFKFILVVFTWEWGKINLKWGEINFKRGVSNLFWSFSHGNGVK
jgi:hypothetical protein